MCARWARPSGPVAGDTAHDSTTPIGADRCRPAGGDRWLQLCIMSWLVIQALWFGLAALIISIDKQLVPPELDSGVPDLRDRGTGQFLALMVIFGGLVIPFYLWHSRRTAAAVVAGIGLAIGCAFVIGLFASVLL
jgi:hypothetical protein